MQKNTLIPNVAKASGIVVISVLLSRIVGVIRDTIMVSKFGSNALTDAYGLSFQIPDLFAYLLISGALSSAFVPVFSEYFHTDRKDEAWKIFSTVTLVISAAMIVLLGLTWIFIEPLAEIVIGGKAPETALLVSQMSRILLPAQFAFMLGGLMFGTLYARQQFAIPGLSFSLYNIGIIVGAVFISNYVNPGVVGMAWGALIGAFIGNVIVPIWAMKRAGSQFIFKIDLKHPGSRKVFKLMLPVIFGLSLPYLYTMISRYLGSYYPDGVVTSLDLSNKLMQLPLGVLGQSLALAAFPALAQFFAQGEMGLFRSQIEKTIRTVLYISIPISVMMFVLSEDVIVALLQYGKFNKGNTAVVSHCLEMFAIGIGAWCVQPVLMRGFYAIHNTFVPFLLSTGATLLFAGLAVVLGQTFLGYLGIPLAASVTIIAFVLITFRVLNHYVKDLSGGAIIKAVGQCVFAAGVMGLFIYFGGMFIPKSEGLGRNLMAFVRLGVLGLTGGWIYYFITKFFGMDETSTIDRVIKKNYTFQKG